jgi:phosphatidylglycerol:prolipoprotein diacylglycerol transferase
MDSFFNLYHSLPSHINPEIFQIGFLSIRWYSVGYILAFLTVLTLVWWRIYKKEFNSKQISPKKIKEVFLDVFLVAIFGLMIGARLGYFIFYDWITIFNSPWEIFIPSSEGFFGFSFHGGLLGAWFSTLAYCKYAKINYKVIENLILPAIPLGLFWGRLGNFFNGELWGKPTEKFWGMYPNSQSTSLYHPSQLYEALGEGAIIFLVLWPIRDKPWAQNNFLSLFLILYGVIRFGIEFFRTSPEEHIILGVLTTGQVLCLGMIVAGIYLLKFQSSNYSKLLKSNPNVK